jgi:hypothetical protein
MTASYGIITGVDNTVTAVVARRRIFIIFRTGRLSYNVGGRRVRNHWRCYGEPVAPAITTHESQIIVLGQRLG